MERFPDRNWLKGRGKKTFWEKYQSLQRGTDLRQDEKNNTTLQHLPEISDDIKQWQKLKEALYVAMESKSFPERSQRRHKMGEGWRKGRRKDPAVKITGKKNSWRPSSVTRICVRGSQGRASREMRRHQDESRNKTSKLKHPKEQTKRSRGCISFEH